MVTLTITYTLLVCMTGKRRGVNYNARDNNVGVDRPATTSAGGGRAAYKCGIDIEENNLVRRENRIQSDRISTTFDFRKPCRNVVSSRT